MEQAVTKRLKLEYSLRRRLVKPAWRFVRKKPLGAAAIAFVVALVLVAVFAPAVSTHDPATQDYGAVLKPPSAQHWLGTDNLGRDVYSRIIFGSRVSLLVGISVVGLSGLVGGLLGLVSGYWMGKVDLFVQRLNDVLQALPTLIMAMAVVAALGASMLNVIIAIALVNIPVSLRVMRGSVISIREADHVMAARAIGCSHVRLALVHIFPNCLAPFIVILTAKLGAVILVEAALSFLGLGVSESTPSWGGMLSRFGAEFARVSPWLVLSPGVAISITVIAFNLFGDAIRDVLDPKLRGV